MRTHNIWVIVPAAGCGKRMGGDTPKQYLPLAGRSMLDWTLHRLLLLPEISRVTVAIAPQDQQFAQLSYAGTPRVRRVAGGATRAESVLSGLRSLDGLAHAEDCVLVHDAARPLIHPDDIRAVIQAVAQSPQEGVILATPVADTLKRSIDQTHVDGTVAREGLWQAQTPQAARYGVLRAAIEDTVARGETLTDESGALESAGVPVRLLAAQHPNFKVTTPQDLSLADLIVANQARR